MFFRVKIFINGVLDGTRNLAISHHRAKASCLATLRKECSSASGPCDRHLSVPGYPGLFRPSISDGFWPTSAEKIEGLGSNTGHGI